MKDFYDLWLLARQFDFDGSVLAKSIAATFRNRKTAIDVSPIALTASFAAAEKTRKQWAAFLRKGLASAAPQAFEEIYRSKIRFLSMDLVRKNPLFSLGLIIVQHGITAMTHCSCHCGVPVHKDYWQIYIDKLVEACSDYDGIMCAMLCEEEPACIENKCVSVKPE